MPHKKLNPAETASQTMWAGLYEPVKKTYRSQGAILPTSYKLGKYFHKGLHSAQTMRVINRALAKESNGIWRFGRLTAHIERLTETKRSPQEQRLGLDLARFLPGEFGGWGEFLKTHNRANSILNGDVNTTTRWWTLSPYLHAEFIKKNIPPEKSVKLLLDWANSAKGDRQSPELPGIAKKIHPTPILEHPKAKLKISHQFAQQYAERFADLFI
ncbi:MAG: hypothetical protein ABIH20_05980, partial [Candidatus Diapherotrites archaeon]